MSDFKTIREVLTGVITKLTELQDSLPIEEATPEKPKKVKKEQKPAITLEDVRSVLVTLSRNGFTKDVKQMLKNHGANKLSEVDPKEYESLLQEAKELDNNA